MVWAHLPSTPLSVMKPSAVSSYFQGPSVTFCAQQEADCKLMCTRGDQVSAARGGGESMWTIVYMRRASDTWQGFSVGAGGYHDNLELGLVEGAQSRTLT